METIPRQRFCCFSSRLWASPAGGKLLRWVQGRWYLASPDGPVAIQYCPFCGARF